MADVVQGHPSHLWTVTSAVHYNLPYITYASAIINTSQSTEKITILRRQQASLSPLPQENRSEPPAARGPEPARPPKHMHCPLLHWTPRCQGHICHWASVLYSAAPWLGVNSYQQFSSEFLIMFLTDHCVTRPFCIPSLLWHGW